MAETQDDEWRPEQQRDLGCPLLSVTYLHAKREVTLVLPEFCCTDMRGAIEFAEVRFPEVGRIATIAGKIRSTIYARYRDGGEWFVESYG